MASIDDRIDGHMYAADLFLDAEDFNSAIKECDKALKLDDSRADVWLKRGLTYYESGDFLHAVEDYHKGLDADRSASTTPPASYTWFLIGTAYRAIGNHRRAEELYNFALDSDSTYFAALFMRGVVYCELGDVAKANEDFDKAMELDPVEFERSLNWLKDTGLDWDPAVGVSWNDRPAEKKLLKFKREVTQERRVMRQEVLDAQHQATLSEQQYKIARQQLAKDQAKSKDELDAQKQESDTQLRTVNKQLIEAREEMGKAEVELEAFKKQTTQAKAEADLELRELQAKLAEARDETEKAKARLDATKQQYDQPAGGTVQEPEGEGEEESEHKTQDVEKAKIPLDHDAWESGKSEDALEVTIADKGIETAIREELQKQTGSLTRGDLKELDGLVVESTEVESLSGLEHATNLAMLLILESKVTDISPLAKLVNLVELELAASEITDISPLKSLTNLTELTLSANEISDISPLGALTTLSELTLWSNHIEDLSALGQLTNLSVARLGNNEIRDLRPLTGLTDLTELQLSGNEISDISPLRLLPELSILELTGNEQITDLTDLGQLSNLMQLRLSGTGATDLSPLANLTNLVELTVDGEEGLDLRVLESLPHIGIVEIGKVGPARAQSFGPTKSPQRNPVFKDPKYSIDLRSGFVEPVAAPVAGVNNTDSLKEAVYSEHPKTGTPVCPIPACGQPTIIKTARKSSYKGQRFWGCSTYPACTGLVNIDEMIPGLPSKHQEALKWFAERVGTETNWAFELSDDTFLATKAKGIYKPSWSEYALSVRHSVDTQYSDKELTLGPDGRWRYEYFQENSDPSKRDTAFTNVGLMKCMKDQVPLGVIQKLSPSSPTSQTRYKILGIARVIGWEEGYFHLEEMSAQEYLQAIGQASLGTPLLPSHHESSESSSEETDSKHFVDSLSVSFIAGPEFKGQPLQQIISLTDQGDVFTVRDVKDLLQYRNAPSEISKIFNTKSRRAHAEQAVRRLEDTADRWLFGERRDPRYGWVIPDKYLKADLTYTDDGAPIVEAAVATVGNDENWDEQTISLVRDRLPLLPIEMVNKIRGLKWQLIADITKGLNKLVDDPKVTAPWSKNFPEPLLANCIYSLYCLNPEPSFMKVLIDLKQGSPCSNIGHLTIFDPLFRERIVRSDPKVWIRLYSELRSEEGLED